MTDSTANPAASGHARSLRSTRRVAYVMLALLGGTAGLWAATASISGAVVATAQFVSETNLKKVQHATGGVVASLLVREGSLVKEGDVLLRLDETIPRANLSIIVGQLQEMVSRAARLEAERDQAATMIMPQMIVEKLGDPEIAQRWAGEVRLFEARAAARAGIRAQLQKRIEQLRFEMSGLAEQQAAKIRERAMIDRELVGVRALFQQNLVQIVRLSQLEREAASLDGSKGQLAAQIAQSEGKAAEIELQIIQLTEDLRAEAMKELREIQSRTAELQDRRIAAQDQLNRIDLRAPVSGYVHQLAVFTVGGVISPAEPAMLIVPEGEMLHLEARVIPADIDQLSVGQTAVVKLHAFNQRTTPELNGIVTRIGADVVREPQTGATFYVVRVSLGPEEMTRIAPLKVVAGMQADVFIKTHDRSPFEYLARPIKDQFTRAFRER
jgi:HlyD family secretion protein